MQKKALKRTCVCGAMIGLAIVFCRMLGFPPSGMWRIELSFLPIAFVGMLYGPLWAGASYTIADVVGAAIYTGVNPFIALEKCLMGVVMGLFFHRQNKLGIWKILVSMSIIAVFLDFLMMSFIFHYAFGYAWEAALPLRLVNAAVNLVVRAAILILCERGKVYERFSSVLQ